MRSLLLIFVLPLVAIVFGNACRVADSPSADLPKNSQNPAILTRSFNLGFTPWPWDNTQEAVDWTYQKINDHGDIISNHIEEGVPWNESLNGLAFPKNFQDSLTDRKNRALVGKKVLLQLNPMGNDRKGLALYRGETINAPLSAPWDGYDFDNVNVKTAYLNYVNRVADFLQPDFIQIGVEVNLLIRNNPSKWANYVQLQCYVYNELKVRRPNTPVFVSVFSVPYFPEWSNEDVGTPQLAGLNDVSKCSDIISFSVHPFMSALLAETFPTDYFTRIFSLTNKPIAISESSYPAKVWSSGGLTWIGSPEKQNEFLRLMLEAADKRSLKFVIWFSVRDYYQLWLHALGQSLTGLVWRDTGLFDDTGAQRESLSLWDASLAKRYAP